MARNEGVTLAEFMRLMERRYRNSYEARRVLPGEAQAFLDRCVQQDLVVMRVGHDGITRYSATAHLTAAIGDLT
jgi:hypothetical protein